MPDAEIIDMPQPKLPSRDDSLQFPDNNVDPLPSENDDMELFRQLREWDEEGRHHHEDWRDEAKEDFAFAAVWQWDDADIRALREAKRPSVSIDRIGPNINAVCGLEINNRHRAVTYPREQGDIEVSEIPTAALSFVADETESDDEKSDAFRDLIICGIGWTSTEMDYLEFDDGMPNEVKVPVDQMNWDPHAKRKNLRDARWIRRAVTMPIEEARRLCPGHNDVVLHAGWADISEEEFGGDLNLDSRTYENDNDHHRAARKRVVLLEFQWREVEEYYQVQDMMSGETKDVPSSLGERLVREVPEQFSGIKRQRYAYWRALVGTTVLKKTRLNVQKGFTYKCMTGYRDETRNQWFGLVRAMKDPQRVANNLYSHSLSMFKGGAKQGFLREKDAVKDVRKFERDQAKVGANLEVENDALRLGKIQPITSPPPPAHAHQLLDISLAQVQQSTGIPLEMVSSSVGSGPAQTATLEMERRKAAMNLLAPFFAAKRSHTKEQAKLVMRYVIAFMNDGRLMRLVDEGQTKYVPLWLEDPDVGKYDIIVDESPTSPDARERSWQVIQSVLPMMERMAVPPDLFIEVARYVPDFPAQLLSKFSQALEEAEQPTPEKQREDELKQRGEEAAVAKEEGQAAKEKTAAELNQAKIRQIAADIALEATEQMRETTLAKASPSVEVTEFM